MKLKKGLFAKGRDRESPIVNMEHDYFMENSPHFEHFPRYEIDVKLNEYSSETLKITREDYRLIHQYLCLCENINTHYWKTFSIPIWFNKVWNIKIGGSSKELEPHEYDRILAISKHIAIT